MKLTRLFVALWPSDPVRDALAAARDRCRWSSGARPTPVANRHATLRFIGPVAPAQVAAIVDALRVAIEPFRIRFDKASVWDGGIAVLEPSIVPPALDRLHADLSARLADHGVSGDAHAYRPHVTLARNACGSVAPARIDPIDWFVDGFVLVESRGGRYFTVARDRVDPSSVAVAPEQA